MTRDKWRYRCPNCDAAWYLTRSTMTPRHRCERCEEEFEHPRDAKTGKLVGVQP